MEIQKEIEKNKTIISSYFDYSKYVLNCTIDYFVFSTIAINKEFKSSGNRDIYLSSTKMKVRSMESNRMGTVFSILAIESYLNALFKFIPDNLKPEKYSCFKCFNGKGQNIKNKFIDIRKILKGDSNSSLYNTIIKGFNDLKSIRNYLFHEKGFTSEEYLERKNKPEFIKNTKDCFLLLWNIYNYLNENAMFSENNLKAIFPNSIIQDCIEWKNLFDLDNYYVIDDGLIFETAKFPNKELYEEFMLRQCGFSYKSLEIDKSKNKIIKTNAKTI